MRLGESETFVDTVNSLLTATGIVKGAGGL